MAIDFAIEQGEGRCGPKRVVLLRGFRAEGMRSAGGGDAGPTPAGSAAWSPPSARSAPRHRSCTTTTYQHQRTSKGQHAQRSCAYRFRPSAGAAAHLPGRRITISIRCAYERRKSGQGSPPDMIGPSTLPKGRQHPGPTCHGPRAMSDATRRTSFSSIRMSMNWTGSSHRWTRPARRRSRSRPRGGRRV
jgi:hypothetical protein